MDSAKKIAKIFILGFILVYVSFCLGIFVDTLINIAHAENTTGYPIISVLSSDTLGTYVIEVEWPDNVVDRMLCDQNCRDFRKYLKWVEQKQDDYDNRRHSQ